MFRILRMFVGEKNEEFTSKLLQIKENVLPLQPQSREIAKLRNKNNGALVQLEYMPVTHGVTGSSPVRTAEVCKSF